MIFAFCISSYVLIKLFESNNDIPLYFYPLIQFSQNHIDLSLRLDLYVSTLISVITFVSSIVFIYSINFFQNRYLNLKLIRNFSLLIFGMLIIISSNNLIQFYIAWQIILFSFFLLSNRLDKNHIIVKNSKIFLHNRISDLGLFLSLYLLYTINYSIYFETIFESNNLVENNILFLGTIINKTELAVGLLFLSFILRLRQFFIPNCIYDISNINIPTLTLIFCSSIIPLIVFFIFRFFPLIHSTPNLLNIVTGLSFCLTIIFIYLSLNTTNIKCVISYLVSSKACIIFYIFCLEEYHAAIFLFITLSLSITMLYLCLGFVITKLNNISNVKNMGGLIFKMPSMFLFTLIAFLSIAGIPFFSGYYSNEVIVSSFYFSHQTLFVPSLLLGITVSFLISYVFLKNISLIFLGNNKSNIHQFNKINEDSVTNKIIFFFLGLCVIFTGLFIKDLFDNANAQYFWSLLIFNDVGFSIRPNISSSHIFKNILIFSSLLGMFFAFFNYILMPFALKNYKLKYYKIFILYNKFFLRL
ncbi:proton-conducting transporter membrane subunit [Alphaproteobacteria bacterium]|nr:proton-conducting transporter membrane subunit [Alphaproteobacteria bacterium]